MWVYGCYEPMAIIRFHCPPGPPPPSQEVPLPLAPRCGFQCTGKGGATARCNRCSSMTLLRYVVSVYMHNYYSLVIFNPLSRTFVSSQGVRLDYWLARSRVKRPPKAPTKRGAGETNKAKTEKTTRSAHDPQQGHATRHLTMETLLLAPWPT